MAVTFPYDAMIDELRSIAKSVWAIPDGNPIIESGEGSSFTVVNASLPMAVMELDGEAPIYDATSEPTAGHSAKAVTTRFNYYIWYLMQTSADERDNYRLRQKMIDFKQAILADRQLNGTVTFSRLTGENWTGRGRPWPIPVEEDAGAVAGYVGLDIILSEA